MQIILKAALSALLIIFFTKLSTFAMSHSATYEMDGKITYGTVGTNQSQTITGAGKMKKESAIIISSGLIDITPKDYAQGDTSTSDIAKMELCAPPRYTNEAEDGEVVAINPEFVFKRSGYNDTEMFLEKTAFTWNSLF